MRRSLSRSFVLSCALHVCLFGMLSWVLLSQTEVHQSIAYIVLFRWHQPGPHHPVCLKEPRTTGIPTITRKLPEPHTTLSAQVHVTSFHPARVSPGKGRPLQYQVIPNLYPPRIVGNNQPLYSDVLPPLTFANMPLLSLSFPLARRVAQRSVFGALRSATQIALPQDRPPGLRMARKLQTMLDDGKTAFESIRLGNTDFPSLPAGEPGGRIVCVDKDISGQLRFTRIRHNLSDWWADASSLNALVKWLNTHTRIKTDMNVEGGPIRLTDANLMKTPIAFMTGHDPSLVRSRNLSRGTGDHLKKRLTDPEQRALRKYLVERGGLLVFDDCGVNAPSQAIFQLFVAQLHMALPEYSLDKIPNDHEIYNNYYPLGGPPVGFDIFWWGTHPPKRNYLEGIFVEDRLAALVVRRDYLCAMESVSLPTRSVHYSPAVYRFMTNVVVYALTHGSITWYSAYIPKDSLTDQPIPREPPPTAHIAATPLEARERTSEYRSGRQW